MIPRIPVKKCMSSHIHAVAPTTDARRVAHLMAEEGIGCVLVEQGGEFVGIVTETDLVAKVLAQDADPARVTVESIMSFPVSSIEESETLETAHEMMGGQRVRHLLVTRKGSPVGLISVRSLLDAAYDWALQMKRPH
jgi:CBS domain-containing protein